MLDKIFMLHGWIRIVHNISFFEKVNFRSNISSIKNCIIDVKLPKGQHTDRFLKTCCNWSPWEVHQDYNKYILQNLIYSEKYPWIEASFHVINYYEQKLITISLPRSEKTQQYNIKIQNKALFNGNNWDGASYFK